MQRSYPNCQWGWLRQSARLHLETLAKFDSLRTKRSPAQRNPVENAIHPIALGKKNWLFTGSERAGQRAAAIQTLFGTAQLNELDPSAWLKDTLTKLPAWSNNRIDVNPTQPWMDEIEIPEAHCHPPPSDL